jgi:hypothetical protein
VTLSPAARRAARRVAAQVKKTIDGRQIVDVECVAVDQCMLIAISTVHHTTVRAALFSDVDGAEPTVFAREIEEALAR